MFKTCRVVVTGKSVSCAIRQSITLKFSSKYRSYLIKWRNYRCHVYLHTLLYYDSPVSPIKFYQNHSKLATIVPSSLDQHPYNLTSHCALKPSFWHKLQGNLTGGLHDLTSNTGETSCFWSDKIQGIQVMFLKWQNPGCLVCTWRRYVSWWYSRRQFCHIWQVSAWSGRCDDVL